MQWCWTSKQGDCEVKGSDAPMNTLSALDGNRVAIVITLPGGLRVFRGVAAYEHDASMGNVLRVKVDELTAPDGNPEFVFHEESWKGVILADAEYGCEYLLRVEAAHVAAQAAG